MIAAMVEEAAPLSSPVAALAPASRFAALSQLRYVLLSMRPKQWTKSGIVFLALIFSVNQSWAPEHPSTWINLVLRCALTAAAFSLVSGADYLVNDVRDRESDALHPKKRRRPIAAGLLAPRTAIIWAVALSALGVGGSFLIDWRTGLTLVAYIAVMLGYSF